MQLPLKHSNEGLKRLLVKHSPVNVGHVPLTSGKRDPGHTHLVTSLSDVIQVFEHTQSK